MSQLTPGTLFIKEGSDKRITNVSKKSTKALICINLEEEAEDAGKAEQDPVLECPSTSEVADHETWDQQKAADCTAPQAAYLAAVTLSSQSGDSSDSDVELVRPRHVKRRRILPRTLHAMAPVYSNKVITCLKLLPNDTSSLAHMDEELQRIKDPEDPDSESVSEVQPPGKTTPVFSLNSSEDEEKSDPCDRLRDSSPSPPPTPKTPKEKSGLAYRKIREMDALLKDLGTVVSPSRSSATDETDVLLVWSSPAPELAIKVRRNGEVFRINFCTRDPLQKLAESVASRLEVESSQILLLLRDEELDMTQTPQSLNLTVADIIDCMVFSTSDKQGEASEDEKICLKVQGKEKESHLSIFVEKDEPLQSLMDQYVTAMGLCKKTKVSFIFEGKKLKGKSTAEELGLETDDIIEVWV
ncbi:NFATC2-interacting protein-like [Pelodytes ibericus]